MAIIVQKFGGTSVADAEKIRRAAKRAIQRMEQGYQVVMVASARGKQTDHLIADALELNPNPSRREMDQLLSTGEQQTVSLLAMALNDMGYKAISYTGGQVKIITDSAHSKARIQKIDDEKIHEALNNGMIVTVAGFQGVDDEGNVTTLGRGGSDTSAVALAAAIGAEQCEIYTDVDGIYSTDPRKFPGAIKLDQISYDEMLEMASMGAGVMHGRAIEFGKKYDVKIHVRSSMNESEGTIISHEGPKMEGIVVSGATIKTDMAKISLVGVGNKPGNAARIFASLAKAQVSVDDIIQTEVSADSANLSFTVAKADLADAQKTIKELNADIKFEDIFIREDIAEVSVIGVGMKTHYGVADKMFSSLAKAEINIDSITTSEIRISCIVDKQQGQKALEVVCHAFELDKESDARELG